MSTSRPVLLVVSGTIPDDLDQLVAEGRRPRPDYVVMAEALDAELVDVAAAFAAGGRGRRLLGRALGSNAVLAWHCWRVASRHEVVFTDGEHVGYPYAALSWLRRRRPRHVMIAHQLTSATKTRLHRWLRLGRRIDAMVLYATPQLRYAVDQLGFPADRAFLSSFQVDTRFYDPARVPDQDPSPRPLLCASGRELRDYPTLVEAVRPLDVDLVITTGSPWSRRSDFSGDAELPANVDVRRVEFDELRALYARADLFAVPLRDTDFQTGITTILEGAAMAKAMVVSRTVGQCDIVVDGVTGRYVEPGDVEAMRDAIVELLADDTARTELGRAARAWVLDHATLDGYAEQLGEIVRRVRDDR